MLEAGATGIEEKEGGGGCIGLPTFPRNMCNHLGGKHDHISEENNLKLDQKYGLSVVTPRRLQKARRFGRTSHQSSLSKYKPSRKLAEQNGKLSSLTF
jgi:hypothetical protein